MHFTSSGLIKRQAKPTTRQQNSASWGTSSPITLDINEFDIAVPGVSSWSHGKPFDAGTIQAEQAEKRQVARMQQMGPEKIAPAYCAAPAGMLPGRHRAGLRCV